MCRFPLQFLTLRRTMNPHWLCHVGDFGEGTFMRALAGCVLALSQLFLVTALSARQADSNDPTATASCDFEAGMQITAKYNSSTMSGKDLPRNGKLWMPGGSPITLFTQVPVILDHIEIPVGA